MTARVVGAIAPRLERAEIEGARRKPTESLDAYDFLLRGLANFYKWTREANEEALHLYYKAIELDAEFSAAYVSAAGCFSMRKGFGWVIDREKEIAEARRLARRAVQLGKNDATVLCDPGHTLSYVAGELDDGAAFVDQALLINPNLAWGWANSGWAKVWVGEPDRAIERFAHAMRLSPIDPFIWLCKKGWRTLISLRVSMMRPCPGQRGHCEISRIGTGALRIGVASCALAGRGEEPKRLIARLLEIDPARRISNFQNVLGPYRKPEHPAKYADALRKAGLPE